MRILEVLNLVVSDLGEPDKPFETFQVIHLEKVCFIRLVTKNL